MAWAAFLLALVAAKPAAPIHSVDGGLPRAVVEEVLALHGAQARACFDGGVHGEVQVDFSVAAQGGLSHSGSARPHGAGAATSKCIRKAVQSWRFPSADAGTFVRWTWPTLTPELSRDAGLSPAEAEAGLDAAAAALATCGESSAEGKISVAVAFGASGFPLDARVVSRSATLAAHLEKCVLLHAAAWRVAAGAPGTVRESTFQFIFGHRAPDAGAGEPLTRFVSVASEGLDSATVTRLVKQHQREVFGCYEKALERAPGLKGMVRVAFVVDDQGAVKDARIDETDLDDMELQKCITRAIRTWRFQPPAGGADTTIRYKWTLDPRARHDR
ncbi:MAG: TonB family protein [Myxococcales bacterium]|nr:TonB family protein [Myxococcales bacterium]